MLQSVCGKMLVVIAATCAAIASVFVFLFNHGYSAIFYSLLECVVKPSFTTILLIFFIFTLYYIYQCFQRKVVPVIHYSDEKFYRSIVSSAPIITECYIPTFMWGHCGHIQTIIFALWGRFNCPDVRGERIILNMPDGATLSYDIFHSDSEKSKDDIMFFVAPGFANNAETDYIRTFMQYVTALGYRCAVLNHIGTLNDVPVTSPRIFSFGNTNDLHAALTDYISKYPKAKVILFGYSLGGNLVPKYLGEDRERSPNIIAGFSICSLIDANRAVNGSEQSRLLRHFYHYFLARTIKSIVLRHRETLLSEVVIRRHNLDVNSIVNAMSLVKFDEAYTRRLYNFQSLEDYYKWSSAVNYLNGIKVPMIFINCLDDPLLSDVLHHPVREFAVSKHKVIAVELEYGGHLGFFENNCIVSESVTWLEKALIQLAEALYKEHTRPENSNQQPD